MKNVEFRPILDTTVTYLDEITNNNGKSYLLCRAGVNSVLVSYAYSDIFYYGFIPIIDGMLQFSTDLNNFRHKKSAIEYYLTSDSSVKEFDSLSQLFDFIRV